MKPSLPTNSADDIEKAIDDLFQYIWHTGSVLLSLEDAKKTDNWIQARQSLLQLIKEAKIEQTNFLKVAHEKFGRVDFEAAIYELNDRVRFSALPEATEGGLATSEEAKSE